MGAKRSKGKQRPDERDKPKRNGEQYEAVSAAFSAERSKAGRAAVAWAAHLGSYFQMDKTGHRRVDFSPERPPISPEYIIQHTGIELSEVQRF
jgi:hypothetical protein